MLDAHPELAMPPETHFVPQFIQASGRLRFNPKLAMKAIRDDTHRRWNDFGLDEDELLRAMEAVEPFNTADALRAFYVLYAERHGKPRWGDKTPDYVRKMKKIQNTLPEARFIHVIRDGRDAGLSQNARIAKRGKDPMPGRELARRWRKRIVKSRIDAEELEDYLEVRYEDLITRHRERPAPGLRARRARLRPGDARLPRARRRAARGDGRRAAGAGKGRPEREAGERVEAHALTTEPPQADRVAVWKREMSPEDNAEFEQAAGYLLADLGYETATPKEDWIPPEEWARSKSPHGRARHRGQDVRRDTKLLSRHRRATHEARLLAHGIAFKAEKGRRAPRAGAVRRRHEPLGDDAAADDARRPSRPDDPAGDPLRPRPDQGLQASRARRRRTRSRR